MNTLKFGNGEWYGKKDTILAYNDENSNFKPLPFSFDRASSATRVNKDGLIETVGSGEPRIDYKDDSNGALLLEPSRTNLAPYSDFTNAGWTKSNATVTLSSELSPMGILNAYDVAYTSGGYILETVSTTKTIGSSETISVFSKSDIVGTFLKFGGGTASGTDVEKKEDYGNGWFRYSVTRTFTEAETGSTQLIISSADIGLNATLFGPQVEQGYATSYIPTSGGVVTRVVDFAEQDLPNDNILIDNNSTIYFEVDTTDLINNTPNTGGFNFKNSGGTSKLNFNYGYGRMYSNYYTGSTSSIVSPAEIGRYKIAFPLTNGSYLYVNGVQKSATSRDWSSISISEIEILFGHSIIDFKLYNTILSNSELQALTTI